MVSARAWMCSDGRVSGPQEVDLRHASDQFNQFSNKFLTFIQIANTLAIGINTFTLVVNLDQVVGFLLSGDTRLLKDDGLQGLSLQVMLMQSRIENKPPDSKNNSGRISRMSGSPPGEQ